MGTSATTIAGNPPVANAVAITLLRLRAWVYRVADAWLAHCPLARGTTYYFDLTAGNDTTGTGTEALPFKTLAKAQAMHDAWSSAAGGLRLRFKRGETWRQTTGLSISKSYVTVDDYGSAAASKPVLTCFTLQYPNGTAWTSESGNVYRRTEASDVGRFREAGDVDNPYVEATSIVTVEANAGSYWYDPATTRLYVHRRGSGNINNDGRGYEAVVSNQTAGIGTPASSNIDSIRVHGIRVDGYGCHRTVQHNVGYGVILSLTGTNLGCVTECEAYHSTTHMMGAANTTDGGLTLWMGNRVGWMAYDAANAGLSFVGYAQTGGCESVFIGNEVIGGTVPATANTLLPRGRSISCHTNGSTTVGLFAALGNRVVAGPYQCQYPAGAGDCPTVDFTPSGDPNACRAFIVDDVFEAYTGYATASLAVLGAGVMPSNTLNANARWRFRHGGTTTTGVFFTTDNQKGMAVNMDLEVDAVAFQPASSGRLALTNVPTATDNTGTLLHCRIHARLASSNAIFGIDYDTLLNSGTSSSLRCINTVATVHKGGTAARFFLASRNSATLLLGLAPYLLTQSAGNPSGYDLATGTIELGGYPPATGPVPASSPLYRAGVSAGAWLVDSDIDGRPRRRATPTIGPRGETGTALEPQVL